MKHYQYFLYIIAFIYYAINSTVLIILPFYAKSMGADYKDIGIIMGSYMFVSIFLRPIAGMLGDKFNVFKLFIFSLVINSLVLLLLLIESVNSLIFVRGVQGAVLAFVSMGFHLLVIKLLDDEKRAQGIVMLSLMSMIPLTFVPGIIIYIKAWLSIQHIIIGLVIFSLINLLLLYVQYHKAIKHVNISKEVKDRRTESSKHVINPGIIVPSFIMLIASVVFSIAPAYFPIIFESEGVPYAPLYFFLEGFTLIMIRLFGRKRLQSTNQFPKRLLTILYISLVSAPLLLLVDLNVVTIIISAILNGLALSLIYPSLTTYVSFVSPKQQQGYLLGWFIAFADIGSSLGAMMMGYVLDFYDYRTVLLVGSIVGVIGLLLIIFKGKRGGMYVNHS
ncbi:MFS transporter [Heyndrickxia sp. NPDC080065]|uniref:MFS transporter n=1 Tax=Heyndrickxia sp. NPDC080065 TaxID=3390568 RepID=UPI003D0137EE